jgi:hypothetical protein
MRILPSIKATLSRQYQMRATGPLPASARLPAAPGEALALLAESLSRRAASVSAAAALHCRF